MNEDTGVQYMLAWQPGKPIDGLGGVGEVQASSDPNFTCGDLISGVFLWPWAVFFTIDSKNIKKVRVHKYAATQVLFQVVNCF